MLIKKNDGFFFTVYLYRIYDVFLSLKIVLLVIITITVLTNVSKIKPKQYHTTNAKQE